MMLKTDLAPLDFVYISQQLPEIIRRMNLQQPQLPPPQLPIPITDLQPVDVDQRKKRTNEELLFILVL